MTPEEQTNWLFSFAYHLILRDRLDPQEVHMVLCEIDEYRDGLLPGTSVYHHNRAELNAELDGGSDDRPY